MFLYGCGDENVKYLFHELNSDLYISNSRTILNLHRHDRVNRGILLKLIVNARENRNFNKREEERGGE